MSITIAVFERAFDEGRGLARDMRVRWALEEVGQAYAVRLVPWERFKEAAHLARNPFGQIPTLEEGDLKLFESGAIVLHIAERFPGLLPNDANARARAIQWMFAALNTIEPPILERQNAFFAARGKSWQGEHMAMIDARIDERLGQVSAHLGDDDWLDGAFSAGDLMMVHVLQRLKPSGLLEAHANLVAYIARAEARPPFQRAFAAQKAAFEASQHPLPREGERAG